jgi:nitrilase
MSSVPETVKVAVIQGAPLPFDLEGTVDKVVRMTLEAGEKGAKLVLLPEAFVGGYPWGLAFGTAVGGRSPAGRRTWERYWAGAIDVPGPETARFGEAAREAGAYLAVGIVERDSTYSRGTLYCTLLYFGPDGSLLGKHRKLKPTAAERLIWGEGDGSTMPVVPTPFGRVGGLICWENYMPLARMAMYGKGVGWPCTERASTSIWHQRPMHGTAGNRRSSISPWKAGASCWGVIST